MAEDLHNDNFEDLFRDSLKESSEGPAENNWDVPSDQVWKKIDQSINQEDDSDDGFIWLTFLKGGSVTLLLLAFLIAGYLLFDNEEINNSIPSDLAKEQATGQSSNPVNASNQSLVDPSIENSQKSAKSSEILNETKAKISKEHVSKTSTSEEAMHSEINQNNSVIKEKTKASTADRKPKNKVPNLKLKNEQLVSPEKDTLTSTSKKKDIAQVSKNEKAQSDPFINTAQTTNVPLDSTTFNQVINAILPLAPIPAKYLLVDGTPSIATDTILAIESPFTDLNKKNILVGDKVKKFYAGISIAPAYTYRKVISRRNPFITRTLNQNEKARFSFNAGIQLGYQFSKNWSIESGLTYSRQSTQYRAPKQVRYSMTNERLNSRGEFERDYNLDLETSSGNISTDIALARTSDTSIPENDFINLVMTTKQQISYGSIPLILRYQAGSNKWKFGLKAGLLNKFVLDAYSKIESVTVLRPGIRFISSSDFPKTRKLTNLKKYQTHYLFGAGLSYYLNDRCWIYAEPTFSRSFNPSFQTRNFKTLPSVSSLELGFNYLF